MPSSTGTTAAAGTPTATTSRLRTETPRTAITTPHSKSTTHTTTTHHTPPTQAQLTDFTVSTASSSAHRAWVSDLRALWSRADERFADVAWVCEGGAGGDGSSDTHSVVSSPPHSPRTRSKPAITIVYAHRAVILVRAPKSIQAHGWLSLPTVQRQAHPGGTTAGGGEAVSRKAVVKKPPQPPSSFHMKTSSKSSAGVTPASPRKPLERRRISGNAASSTGTTAAPTPAPTTSPPLTRRASNAVPLYNLSEGDGAVATALDELADAIGYLYRAGPCSTSLLTHDALPTDNDEGYDRLSADLLTLWKSRQWTDVTLHVSVAPPSRSGTPTTTTDDAALLPSSSSSLLVLPPMADAEEEESRGSFAVHKFVLVSRCPYFAAQFLGSNTYADSNAHTVNLPPGPPFTPTALYFTLGFLYTGTLAFSTRTFDLTIAFEIWRVAAYLQVRTLTDLVAVTIAQDFCHGFRCHATSCQTCAKRVPRTLAFAAAPDVAEGVLYHLALSALTRGEFAVYWAREVGSMDGAIRRDIVEGVRETIRQDVSNSINVLRQLMVISTRLDTVRTVKWVDNLRCMVDEITSTLQTHLVMHFDSLSTNDALHTLLDGTGLHFDVIERLLHLLTTSLSSHAHRAPRIYQSLVGNILLRGEDGLETGRVRDIVESARKELIQFLSKRWVGIRAQAGFNALEKWALGEIASEIDVRKEELLLPDDESVSPREKKAVSPTMGRKAATNTANAERTPGPINLRAAVLNRNAARVGAGGATGTGTATRVSPIARSNGARAVGAGGSTTTRPASASASASTAATRPTGASTTAARVAGASSTATTRTTPSSTATRLTSTRPTTNTTARTTTARATPSAAPRTLRASTSTNQLRAVANGSTPARTAATTNGSSSHTSSGSSATPARVVRRARQASNESSVSASSSRTGTTTSTTTTVKRPTPPPKSEATTSLEIPSDPPPPATHAPPHAPSAESNTPANNADTQSINTPTPHVQDNVSGGDHGEQAQETMEAASMSPPPEESHLPSSSPDEMLQQPAPPPLPLPSHTSSSRTTPSPPPAAHTRPARPVLGTKVAGLAARFSASGSSNGSPTTTSSNNINASPISPLPRIEAPSPTTSTPPPSANTAYSSAAAFAARKRRLSTTPRSRTTSSTARTTSPLARTLSPSLSTHPVYAAARRKSSSPALEQQQYPTRSASVVSLAERRATAKRRTVGEAAGADVVTEDGKERSGALTENGSDMSAEQDGAVRFPAAAADQEATAEGGCEPAEDDTVASSVDTPAQPASDEDAATHTTAQAAGEPVDSGATDTPAQAASNSVGSHITDTPPQATSDSADSANDTTNTDALDTIDTQAHTVESITSTIDTVINDTSDETAADTAEATNTTTTNATSQTIDVDGDGDTTAETQPTEQSICDESTRDLSVESKDEAPAEQAASADTQAADEALDLSSSTDTELVTHNGDDGEAQQGVHVPGEADAESNRPAEEVQDDDVTAIVASQVDEAARAFEAPTAEALDDDAVAVEATPADEAGLLLEAEAEEQDQTRDDEAEDAAPDASSEQPTSDVQGDEASAAPIDQVEDAAAHDDAVTEPEASTSDNPIEGKEAPMVTAATAHTADADDAGVAQDGPLDSEDASGMPALASATSSEDVSNATSSLLPRATPPRLDTSSEPFPESSGPRTPRAMRTMTLPVESDLTPRPSKFLSDVGDVTVTRAARASESGASPMPPATSLSVGIPCIIWPSFPGLPPRTRMRAVVKYIGPVDGYVGAMVGVEVPLPLADAVQACQDQFNDGTANGKRYFHLGPSWASRNASAAVSGTTTPASGGGSPPSPSMLSLSGSGGGASRLSIHLDMFARAEREARKRRIARLQANATRVVSAPPSGSDAGMSSNGSVAHIRYNSTSNGNGNTATIRGPRHSGPALSNASARGIFASAPTSPLDELQQPSFHRRRESSSAGSMYQQSNASLSTLTGSMESDLDGECESSVFGMRFSPRAATGMPAVPQHHTRRPSLLMRSPSILSLSSLHEHDGAATGKLTRANLRSLSGSSSVSSRSPSPSPVLQQFEDDGRMESRRANKSTTMGPPPPPSSYNQSTSTLHPFSLSSRSRRSSWSPSVAGSVRSASTITSRRNTGSRHGGGGGTASFMERMEDESTPRLGLFVRPDEVVWIFEDE